jgi:hypothetical protein
MWFSSIPHLHHRVESPTPNRRERDIIPHPLRGENPTLTPLSRGEISILYTVENPHTPTRVGNQPTSRIIGNPPTPARFPCLRIGRTPGAEDTHHE